MDCPTPPTDRIQSLQPRHDRLDGGAEGADRVQFTSPPSSGAIVSCDFTGLMRIRCRFREDAMTKEYMANGLYRTGLELKGLKGN